MPLSAQPSPASQRKDTHTDAINPSPGRQSKRRKRAHSPDEIDEVVESSDDYIISQVTQHLKTQPAQATKDHANAIHETNGNGVKAYAKVAAHDWTFYITKLSVNIGRAPEVASAENEHVEETHIHIDLGPSKMVSRDHASISFDSKDEKWLLRVKGRNGAKLDGQVLRPHASRYLTSGQVIEVGNVEMMFVLPSEISPLYVHSIFLKRCSMDPILSSLPFSAFRRQPLRAPVPPHCTRPGTPTSALGNACSSGTKFSAGSNASLNGSNCADLSHDENQHIKPQYSYAQMITQAIINAPDGKLNLSGIYAFIMEKYSYYRHQQAAGWQNSIRHNLSLNKSFEKVARSNDELGKGMKWQIVPEARDDMVRNAYKLGRGGHRGSSAPTSPSHVNYVSHDPRDKIHPSPRKHQVSPLTSLPLASLPPRLPLPVAQSTPERHSDRGESRATVLTVDGSPFPRHERGNISADRESSLSNFNTQSPTLTSSYLQEDGLSLVTPAPPRIHPKLVPPSTAQRPSQHMPTSSPAPFWKYAEIGSTPLRPSAQYEMSPSKVAGRIHSQSSSPRGACKSPPSSPSRPHKYETSVERDDSDEINEDQGFDLTKGFQTISSYHAPVSRGMCIANALQGRSFSSELNGHEALASRIFDHAGKDQSVVMRCRVSTTENNGVLERLQCVLVSNINGSSINQSSWPSYDTLHLDCI